MTLHKSVDQIVARFEIQELLREVHESFNIAPSQQIAVITETAGGKGLDRYKWGLVPHWADDPSIGNKMINARAETIAEKPSFKSLLTRKRCIIPADGFYEWKVAKETAAGTAAKKAKKIPMHIRLKDGALFGFAGLWTEWKPRGSDAPPLRTCTVITTAANELMQPIHHRMPVILRPEDEADWLNPDNSEAEALVELLQPYESAAMEAYEVSTRVNTPAFNAPECIEPSTEKPPIAGEKTINSK
jgi:putative SOS response-associated peptidase YedK